MAYSRRGVDACDISPDRPQASAVDDLGDVLNAVSIPRCHLLGSAAGGFIGPFIPHRLCSLTIACSTAGIDEESGRRDSERLAPTGFREVPPDFPELSGSYRLANPEGRQPALACWPH
jgi:hypothetical protein